MKASQAHLSPLLLALSLSLACNHAGDGAAPGATNPPGPAPATAPAPRAERGGHGADPTNALLRATAALQLSDAQKSAIHGLEEQLEANEKDTGVAFKAQRTDLAAQVRAGALDKTKVDADANASANALQVHIAKEADTLNGLHAALEPSQRKAAVAAVRAGQAEHAESQPPATMALGPPAEEVAKRRLDRLTRELGLDSTQQPQVVALLAGQPAPMQPQMGERKRRMDLLLSAFENDPFDARTAVPAPSPSPADMIRESVEREVAFLSKLLPILKPDQREKLASHTESGGFGRGREDDD